MILTARRKLNRGRTVTAFGVLYDFTGNDKNTTVQSPTDMVKEHWVFIILTYVSGMKLYLTIFIDSSLKLFGKSQTSFCLQATCLCQTMIVGLLA